MTNNVLNKIDDLYQNIYMHIGTLYMKINLRLRQVNYKSNIRFYGRAKFVKSSSSQIIIKDNCTFRSKATSNLIGINRPCIISSTGKNSKLTIGNNCGFSGTVIGCFKKIIIGDNVLCGANTLITDGDWHLKDKRSGLPKTIIIGNNVWLGEGVKVLKGVFIGDNTVIGAGSVVAKSIPDNSIAAGNPCKVIKSITNN